MTFGMTLAEQLKMAASANMFYFAVAYENEPNMTVAARINTKYEISSHVNTKNPLCTDSVQFSLQIFSKYVYFL